MLNNIYLQGLSYTTFEQFPGIYATGDYRDEGSSRFICTYEDGQRHKEDLFDLLNRMHLGLLPHEWELHHIVEGRHFADIDFKGNLQLMYDSELPCVLIHSNEHALYTRIASIRATAELFLDREQSGTRENRSRQTQLAAANVQKRNRLIQRLDRLTKFYNGVYAGDEMMQTIAFNVIKEARKNI